MERRDFLKAAAVLPAILPASLEAMAAQGGLPLLKNEDKEGFYIRFYKPFRPPDINKWRLEVKGLCKNQKTFSLKDLMGLKKASQTTRMKCVECWSAKAQWGGFRPESLFEIVQPQKEALYLYFYTADDYYEYISLEDMRRQGVMFVYEMNGGPLPYEHGAPLRLIIPFKYGYKNVKTITKLSFVAKDGKGYWPKYGYSADGTIETGADHPLDLGGIREIKKPGELEY